VSENAEGTTSELETKLAGARVPKNGQPGELRAGALTDHAAYRRAKKMERARIARLVQRLVGCRSSTRQRCDQTGCSGGQVLGFCWGPTASCGGMKDSLLGREGTLGHDWEQWEDWEDSRVRAIADAICLRARAERGNALLTAGQTRQKVLEWQWMQ
jgi:hypothetical protein